MNTLGFELRSLRTSTLWWFVGLATLISIYIGVYPSFASDAEAARKLFDSLPAAMHAAIGLNLDTLFSFLGFLGNIFTVILLAAAIHGSILGIGIFSREQRSKTTDFLLSKPSSRHSIFLAKLGAGLIVVALTTAWVMLVVFAMSQTIDAGQYDMSKFLLITGVFGMVEVWFFAVGALISQLIRKVKLVTPPALGLAFGFFLLGTVGSMIDPDATRWLAPSKYVDFSHVVQYGEYETKYLILGYSIIALAIVISFFIYTRKDIESQI